MNEKKSKQRKPLVSKSNLTKGLDSNDKKAGTTKPNAKVIELVNKSTNTESESFIEIISFQNQSSPESFSKESTSNGHQKVIESEKKKLIEKVFTRNKQSAKKYSSCQKSQGSQTLNKKMTRNTINSRNKKKPKSVQTKDKRTKSTSTKKQCEESQARSVDKVSIVDSVKTDKKAQEPEETRKKNESYNRSTSATESEVVEIVEQKNSKKKTLNRIFKNMKSIQNKREFREYCKFQLIQIFGYKEECEAGDQPKQTASSSLHSKSRSNSAKNSNQSTQKSIFEKIKDIVTQIKKNQYFRANFKLRKSNCKSSTKPKEDCTKSILVAKPVSRRDQEILIIHGIPEKTPKSAKLRRLLYPIYSELVYKGCTGDLSVWNKLLEDRLTELLVEGHSQRLRKIVRVVLKILHGIFPKRKQVISNIFTPFLNLYYRWNDEQLFEMLFVRIQQIYEYLPDKKIKGLRRKIRQSTKSKAKTKSTTQKNQMLKYPLQILSKKSNYLKKYLKQKLEKLSLRELNNNNFMFIQEDEDIAGEFYRLINCKWNDKWESEKRAVRRKSESGSQERAAAKDGGSQQSEEVQEMVEIRAPDGELYLGRKRDFDKFEKEKKLNRIWINGKEYFCSDMKGVDRDKGQDLKKLKTSVTKTVKFSRKKPEIRLLTD